MSHAFLSSSWFDEVERLVASAGDLKIPAPMKAADINVVVTSPKGNAQLHLKDGLFHRGHLAVPDATLTLDRDLARRIFVDADAAAGVQAFLEGKITVDGDLAKVVAMQTVEPSEPQKQLAKKIAAITTFE
jgi:hypothetical protein